MKSVRQFEQGREHQPFVFPAQTAPLSGYSGTQNDAGGIRRNASLRVRAFSVALILLTVQITARHSYYELNLTQGIQTGTIPRAITHHRSPLDWIPSSTRREVSTCYRERIYVSFTSSRKVPLPLWCKSRMRVSGAIFWGVGFQREKIHSLSAILVDLAVPLNGKNNHTWAMGVAEAF